MYLRDVSFHKLRLKSPALVAATLPGELDLNPYTASRGWDAPVPGPGSDPPDSLAEVLEKAQLRSQRYADRNPSEGLRADCLLKCCAASSCSSCTGTLAQGLMSNMLVDISLLSHFLIRGTSPFTRLSSIALVRLSNSSLFWNWSHGYRAGGRVRP